MQVCSARTALSFHAINRKGHTGYDPGLQKHHLLPRQLLKLTCFDAMFQAVKRERAIFHDFRANGLLLPAREIAALRMGLPLHRGPHRHYNGMVIERVGQIEEGWSSLRLNSPEVAFEQAVMRLSLLQRTLRRRLLDSSFARLILNRRDPLGRNLDFTDLDAMADSLWGCTSNIDALPQW